MGAVMSDGDKPAAERKRPQKAVAHPNGDGAFALHANAPSGSLDGIDEAIIGILQEDGRAPFTVIAKQLDISDGAVRNRVGQLIQSKVLRIIGVANPLALGYNAYAMLGLKVQPGHDPQEIALYYRDFPEVTYIVFVAGRYDLLVEVICRAHDDLAAFLREHCYGRPDIASVEPMVSLAMYKNMLKWGKP